MVTVKRVSPTFSPSTMAASQAQGQAVRRGEAQRNQRMRAESPPVTNSPSASWSQNSSPE